MSSVTLTLFSLNYKERHMFMSLEENLLIQLLELLVPISKMATSVITIYDK